jgi:hypothetical protein
MSFLNNNMSFKYNIRKITPLPITSCKHKVYPYFLWNRIWWLYHQNWIFLLLKACIVICTLPFILIFLLKTHLDLLGFILSGGSTKFQTWLVRKVHSFKLFLGINIIYYFQVINNLISYEQHVIHSFHERSFSR